MAKPTLTLLSRLLCAIFLLVAAGPLAADPAPFDLSGPTLEVTVTRAGKTLPVSEAPNLSVGDQLWMRADLPADQSARYRLVAVFLRGATDPPPKTWFYDLETWGPKAAGGLTITVPPGARQALIFLAPATGGDFQTLRGAVRGRPGAFVRAAQDLDQAELDRSRLDAYQAAIREISRTDPDRLKTVAPTLARSLAIKLDSPCLEKPPALQGSCLIQGQEALILDDGRGASVAQSLTSGSTADLVQQLSVAPPAGGGAYSPYVGAVLDIVRIMDSFHTAQFQYLPALATADGDKLSLLLNAPPSFHNPKSVLVVALPAVGPAQPPLLHPTDPTAAYCAERKPVVLPVEGAPTLYSTGYAHDLALRVKAHDGAVVELPVRPDAEVGGLVVDTSGFDPKRSGGAFEGVVHGSWGFDPYSGPSFPLQNAGAARWRVGPQGAQALIAGRDGDLRLSGGSAACVESIAIVGSAGQTVKVDWKAVRADEVQVKAPGGPAKPGAVTLLIKSSGEAKAEELSVKTFAEPSRLERFTIHAGDAFGVLQGSRLDEVDRLTLLGVDYRRDPFTARQDGRELPLYAVSGEADTRLITGDSADAKVTLGDGRTLDLDVSVAGPRPSVTLIAKSVQGAPSGLASQIRLGGADVVPRGAVLTFSVRSRVPATFSGDDRIEVATRQGEFMTSLTLAKGLTLQDPQVAIATLDTGKAFNTSAAGPLRYRIVADGVAGNWSPLATLVRLPVLHDLTCPSDPERPCMLAGAGLYLLDALASDLAFDHAVLVPDGFPGPVLTVPHPTDGRLYVRLRDDPTAIEPVTVPVKRAAAQGSRLTIPSRGPALAGAP